MKIISLAENRTNTDAVTVHGLSLYIETNSHKILFDLGPDGTAFANAVKYNVDMTAVDTVIISHGHVDHGGALKQFMKINKTADIYIQRKAFEPHYSKFLFMNINVGIDKKLMSDRQITLLDGDYVIDDELSLFTTKNRTKCYSPANNSLITADGPDDFSHEQNLIIDDEQTVLIMGCGHSGVVNIMKEAEKYSPKYCIGGFHLFNPLTRQTVPDHLLDEIYTELKQYDNVEFCTCHCTGKKAYEYLASKMENMHYLACGDTLEIGE